MRDGWEQREEDVRHQERHRQAEEAEPQEQHEENASAQVVLASQTGDHAPRDLASDAHVRRKGQEQEVQLDIYFKSPDI